MMSKIVRTMASFLILFVLIYGLYIIMHGHSTPGGGFQGGAVVASGVALLIVAFGSHSIHRSLLERRLSILISIGLLIFIGLAFGGMAGTFFYNFLVGSPIFGHIPPSGPNPGEMSSGGVIPIMDIGVGLNVAGGLSAILLVMALATTVMEVEE